MKTAVLVAVAMLPLTVMAQPVARDRSDREAERVERAEQRGRLRRVLELSDALELDSAQALKMNETLRTFDEKRRPLREQVRESARILHLAARGDSAAQAQVDAAAQRAFDARTQILALDREMFQALARDLPPQKRARLALALVRAEGKGMKLKLDKAGGDD